MLKSLKISTLTLAIGLAAGSLHAAGLGRLSVQSSLGQPLRAEIELLAVQPEELGTVVARLAGAEAFRQARLDRADVLGALQFSIDQRNGARPVVRITSSQPVNEPFLDLLIELGWSSGRILREYTVLLDPPADTRPPVETPPAAQAPVVPATVPASPPAAEPAKAQPAPTPTSEPRSPVPDKAGADKYGPVKRGETLRTIADKVKSKDVTLDMMMAGLYQANRAAFARDNINLLRKGSVLAVPAPDALMQAFSPKQANELVRSHSAAWQAYRNQVAAQADQPAKQESKPAQEAAKGKIVTAPEKSKAVPAPSQSSDVLKLSKGQPGADAKAQQRVQALEEEVAGKARALKEASERVAQLEKTVKDMQQLIRMKDAQQKQAPTPVPKPEAAKPEPAKPEPVKPVEKPVEAPVKVAPPPPAPEEPGFLASLLAKPLYLGGILAAILLGLLGWLVLNKRRRSNLAQLEQHVINSGDDFKTAIFRTTTGATTQLPTTQQTSVMTDFSRLGLGAIDTHEVDPIAEAEVYMAYGRDAQAEEILKEALNKDPGRHEIAMKLLEIYATRHDTVAFETQASEIYAALSGQPTPLWAKVTEMGRAIDPDNPLYQFSGATEYPEPPEEAPAPAAIFQGDLDDMGSDFGSNETVRDMGALFTEEQPPEPAPPAPVAMEDLDGVIDFQIDMEPEEPARVEPARSSPASNPFAQAGMTAERDGVQEFPDLSLDNLDMGDLPADFADPVSPAPAPTPVPASAFSADEFAQDAEPARPEALPDLDFSGIDLDLTEPLPEAAPVETVEVMPAHSDDDDMPGADPGGEADDAAIDPEIWEEVNTKLDLAKAYLEMGDKEGAREILEEVLREGSRQQRSQADELIAATA